MRALLILYGTLVKNPFATVVPAYALLLPALAALGVGDRIADPPTDPPSRGLLLELAGTTRLAGTSGSAVAAKFVARTLEEAGWKVEIDAREVLLSLPRSIEFAIYDDAFAEKPVVEREDRFDPDAIPAGDVPKCNGWSGSGTVRAAVVDAGYGIREDFERLKSLGVEVRGAIALARYGKCYRGIKVDLAAQYGCSAVLLFSDPEEDGPAKGPVWPEGPWKPDWDAQRGSINPIAHVPGDPSTPGWPSPRPGTKDARRASADEIREALPKIPCLPLGWRDAKALLGKLATVQVKDKDGRESPVPLGPGPVQARIAIDQPRDLRTIRNVVARLPGASEDTVIGGAHRDSWVRGANDDGAGTVAMLRAAQLLGEKAKGGWKPKRTITLGFWDAEEFGLIGSTEWGEANEDWLRAHAVAYVNADTAVNGPRFRGAGGSPGMLAVLRRVLERIPPAPTKSGPESDAAQPQNLWEEWTTLVKERAKGDAEKSEPRLGLPGSGSDFAVFVHHLNVPCLEPGFGGSGGGGAYHTTFDDFSYVEKYVDPGFVGHETAGRLFAELLAEIADYPAFFDEVEAEREIARRARETAAECRKDAPESALAASLDRVASGLETSAERISARGAAATSGTTLYTKLEAREGLEGRAWFKNRLWAPGLEDGYGSETFPSLRLAAAKGPEALEAETAWILARLDLAEPSSPHPSGK
jgi:N-acetylated-alpha-linked acidic dipeptidase